MSESSACPACPATEVPAFVETHRDRIGGTEYRIMRCPACGVVFSLPRKAVGPEWYEKAAPIRNREVRPPPERDWRYQRFFEEGFPGGKLLDVGCGDGGFLGLAKERGFDPVGFDYEQRMVDLAHARGIADAEAAEFYEYCRRRADGEFDCITLFDVLEHTPEPGLFLAELKRLLKPGGHLVATLPNAKRPLPWGREEHDYPPHHFTRWSPEAMRGFLERNGFRIVRQRASDLKVYYLSENLFFFVVMPRLLGLVRRVLFGRSAGDRTITELYAAREDSVGARGPEESGWGRRLRAGLADKWLRQRLVNALKIGCRLFTYPVACVQAMIYRRRDPECGDCLYTAARLESKGAS